MMMIIQGFIITITLYTNTLRFETAVTHEQKTMGLMYRREWEDIDGMIFIYQRPQRVAFWMKNTYLKLDMLFLDKYLNIKEIHSPPILSTDMVISSDDNIQYILELNPLKTTLVTNNYSEFKKQLKKQLKKVPPPD